jgi:hypothetical protein
MSAQSKQRADEILDRAADTLIVVGVLVVVVSSVGFITGLLIQLWLSYVFGLGAMPHWITVWQVVAVTSWFIGVGLIGLGKVIET